MSKSDAADTKYFLERAKEAAKPLKDADLEKKIGAGLEHVTKRLDTQQS